MNSKHLAVVVLAFLPTCAVKSAQANVACMFAISERSSAVYAVYALEFVRGDNVSGLYETSSELRNGGTVSFPARGRAGWRYEIAADNKWTFTFIGEPRVITLGERTDGHNPNFIPMDASMTDAEGVHPGECEVGMPEILGLKMEDRR
jgi:hypothetical protein